MIPNLPPYISVVFILTTLVTLILFYLVLRNSDSSVRTTNMITGIIVLVLIIQMLLGINGFYSSQTRSVPPRFLMLIGPPFLTMIILFLIPAGRKFMDGLPLLHITWLNIIRIPVEFVLYWLFLQKAVPELMTFAGRNFDILAGITAPLIAWFGFTKKKLGRTPILIWNIVSLGLLINIFIHAVFSAPFVFQALAFDQPNIGVLHFPFNWLPAFVAPAVLFGHLVSIRQLLLRKDIP